jgi:hypothetical protein
LRLFTENRVPRIGDKFIAGQELTAEILFIFRVAAGGTIVDNVVIPIQYQGKTVGVRRIPEGIGKNVFIDLGDNQGFFLTPVKNGASDKNVFFNFRLGFLVFIPEKHNIVAKGFTDHRRVFGYGKNIRQRKTSL